MLCRRFFYVDFVKGVNNLRLDKIEVPTLNMEDNTMLTSHMNEEEIKEAMNQCGSAKRSDPGDFNFQFLKSN